MTALRVVHTDRAPELTLSEVPTRAITNRPSPASTTYPGESRNITLQVGTLEALAAAIADHLSPRAAGPVADATAPMARAMRTSYLLDALEKAAACPMCAADLAGAGLELEAVRRG